MRIYFAGPLFTRAEIDFNREVANMLQHLGYEVFLPQEQDQRHIRAKGIFNKDVHGILSSHLVVANMDGADPDSGTCWEVGYAFGLGKPVILYRTDIRSEAPPFGPYNLMLHCSADEVLDCRDMSPQRIGDEINNAIRRLRA